jgi:hypothetical protein
VEDQRGQAGIELHDPRCLALAWESFARLVTVRGERSAVIVMHEPGPSRAMLVPRRGYRTWRHDASALIVDVPAAGATHTFVVDDALRRAIARGVEEL